MSREMKASSLGWAGNIPVSWQELRNRYLFTKNKTIVGDTWRSIQLLSLTTTGIKKRSIDDVNGKVPESYDGYQFVRENQMVMCLFDLDCSAVFSGISHLNGMISPAYNVLDCNEIILPQFADYWFRSVFDGRKYMDYAKNIRYSLPYDDFREVLTLVPPLPEQESIVRYLNSKCYAIDEAIERHRKIIEKLEEYRKAEINRVATQGISKSPKIIKSGNDGFPLKPDGWDIVPLKSKFSFWKGLSITKADLVEEGVPVLSYGQIHAKKNIRTGIHSDLLRFVPCSISDKSPDSLAVMNGFIFADTSEDLEGCGNCNYVDRSDVYGGYHTVILKPKTSDNNRYLSYLFQTDLWRYQIRKVLTEVKVYSVSQKVLKETWILYPPVHVRDDIVAYLDRMCQSITKSIDSHNSIIEKLEEYRKSIIYNAVTGKIDCREDIK